VKRVPEIYKTRPIYIANSVATQTNLMKECGIASVVVPPLFGVEQYAGIQCHGESILFVSLQLRKGVDVAIRIAQYRPQK
jgi:hypothetical protein